MERDFGNTRNATDCIYFRILKDSSQLTFKCNHAAFIDSSEIDLDRPGGIVCHGDKHDPAFSCAMIDVKFEASKKGQKLPPAWDDSGKLSADYLAKASNLKVDSVDDDIPNADCPDRADPRLLRVILADDEAAQLHLAHVHRDNSVIDFQTVLKRSEERIICHSVAKQF